MILSTYLDRSDVTFLRLLERICELIQQNIKIKYGGRLKEIERSIDWFSESLIHFYQRHKM